MVSRTCLFHRKTLFATMYVDITDRKRIEADLIASKDQYLSIVNNIPSITYRCQFDSDWTMLFISAQVDCITGYSADELLHNSEISYGILIHKEDQELVTRVVEEAIANNAPWVIEYRVRHKDDNLRWVYEKATAIKDTTGQVQHLDNLFVGQEQMWILQSVKCSNRKSLNSKKLCFGNTRRKSI